MKSHGPYLKDISFVNLMKSRIYQVLLVANPYDAFMLEDDGRIDEQLRRNWQRTILSWSLSCQVQIIVMSLILQEALKRHIPRLG